MNFVKTTAIWSMIGFKFGLGDRRPGKILINTFTGEVIHVDFDTISEEGSKAENNEAVPFRLKPNI